MVGKEETIAFTLSLHYRPKSILGFGVEAFAPNEAAAFPRHYVIYPRKVVSSR
jgi:hypothetical protein